MSGNRVEGRKVKGKSESRLRRSHLYLSPFTFQPGWYVRDPMKQLALLLLVATACANEQPATTETVDTRPAVAILYVGAPELNVREQPNDTAAIITTYSNGE